MTSLLFLLPMQLGRALQIAMASVLPAERARVINSSLKLNALISLGQLLFIAVFGHLLLFVLFGDANATVLRYTVIIACGVTVANLGWPLISVVNNSGQAYRFSFPRRFSAVGRGRPRRLHHGGRTRGRPFSKFMPTLSSMRR